ncbi:uncharacterized protein F5891DRAFT_1190402 [Suillus fuscotomentosus]|uniref:Uncharacterized protein n=1 Tax=Suillus fuscotomentosus TaxID=1912939 RepID=A0AAD4HII3_9AGAM|nr:uncharacterized protein F5891DRAFT_1190402 [Suillus fuscotomentosus]KAG1898905.1 hypothetical protein F5891DRAFT_1190402 [Suillus fuscotomentosus]
MYFDNLALSLRDRFQQQGAAPDLDGDIEHHRTALHLYSPVILLLPPPFSDLRGQLKEVQLSSSMLISATAKISELSFKFQSIVKQFGSSDHQNELVNILCKLWDHIVDPMVQAFMSQKLAITRVSDGCPAAEFTLLPLHAAGTLREKEKPQIYFSSYTPTLVNLIRARQQVSLGENGSGNSTFLQSIAKYSQHRPQGCSMSNLRERAQMKKD